MVYSEVVKMELGCKGDGRKEDRKGNGSKVERIKDK